MTKERMREVLKQCLDRESGNFDPPSQGDWDLLESRLNCSLPMDLKHFIELMSEFAFPGEIFNACEGANNGNDTIELVYEHEMKASPTWDADKVPFYGIGNGDYFCFSRSEQIDSKVYYYYADRDSFAEDSSSVEDWINKLPEFLDA